MRKELNTPAGTLFFKNDMIMTYVCRDAKYRIGDLVYVSADDHGYICPGIHNEGLGEIVAFQNDATDHFIGVKMLNSDQMGFAKRARVTNLTQLDCSRHVKTVFMNWKLIVDNHDMPVALMVDGTIRAKLGDRVTVSPDRKGYICPGIFHGGLGRITQMRSDNADYIFGVTMYDGSFGFMKLDRITRI